uniref:Uncharacterized protein n=1 Tax=Arundo donax TaxID=35708 RepID=A0A0A9A975_ARUDO
MDSVANKRGRTQSNLSVNCGGVNIDLDDAQVCGMY